MTKNKKRTPGRPYRDPGIMEASYVDRLLTLDAEVEACNVAYRKAELIVTRDLLRAEWDDYATRLQRLRQPQ